MKAIISQKLNELNRNNQIRCDAGCDKLFPISIQSEDIGEVAEYGQVSRRYIECPHCGQQYNAGFVNEEVDRLFSENRVLSQQGIKTSQETKLFKYNKKRGTLLMKRIKVAWFKERKPDADKRIDL